MIWTACEEDMVSISADMVKAQKMWFRLKCSSVFQRIFKSKCGSGQRIWFRSTADGVP
jgi:hypothetical protein